MKISCCMIVKNEEKVLENTLKAAASIFDEIVVVDTGSADRTMDIARKYTGSVFTYSWDNDFAAARNYSLTKATHDYVFILDADEQITEFDKKQVQAVCTEDNLIGLVKRRSTMETGQVYVEHIKRYFNRNIYRYEGIIHEQIVPVKKFKVQAVKLAVSMDHIGYLQEVLKRTNKVDRNINLLKSALDKNGLDPYLLYQLGKSYELKKDPATAKKYFEKAISCVNTDDFKLEYVVDLFTSYGYMLLKLEQYQAAMEMEKYAGHFGAIVDYRFLMAHIYMNNGYFDRAVEFFESCIGEDEGKIEGLNRYLAFYNIGVIFECLGYREESIRRYALCSGYAPAQARLKVLVKK